LKRRISQDVWIIIVLLALATLVGVFTAGRQTDSEGIEIMPKRTTYLAGPSGLKALYITLDELGYRMDRHIEPLTTPAEDGVLFIVDPDMPISDVEWQSARKWVQKGNILVVANGDDKFSSKNERKTKRSTPNYPSFLCPCVRSFRASDADRITDKHWTFQNEEDLTERRFPRRKSKKSAPGKPKPEPGNSRPLAPLFSDASGTTIAYSSWGKGGVIVISSPWSLSNEGIGSDDNLTLVLNAINSRASQRKMTVTFDEYHHGYSAGKGILSLIGLPAKLGLAQIAVAFMLLILAASSRFGRALTLNEGARQRGEYLSSMSSLLRKANALRLVKSELGRYFTQKAAVALGLPPNSDRDSIVEAATRRSPEKAEEIRGLLDDATDMSDHKLTESSVFAAAKRWHDMRKDLRKRS
jgi:hypothetical protein